MHAHADVACHFSMQLVIRVAVELRHAQVDLDLASMRRDRQPALLAVKAHEAVGSDPWQVPFITKRLVRPWTAPKTAVQ